MVTTAEGKRCPCRAFRQPVCEQELFEGYGVPYDAPTYPPEPAPAATPDAAAVLRALADGERRLSVAGRDA